MRLVLVSQDFPPTTGGIQTYASELAARFATRLDAFAVVAPQHPEAEAFDRQAPYPVYRSRLPSDLLVLSPLVRRAVRDTGATATLHAQWQTALAALRLRRAGRLHTVGVAAHGRELLLAGPPAFGPLYDAWRNASLRRADAVLAVSGYTAGLARALGVAPARLRVVPNGVRPLSLPAAVRSDGPVLLTVARLVRRKGVADVLDAVARLVPRYPALRYHVVGNGPERTALEAQAARLGLGAHVRFEGTLRDDALAALYARADVFALPPRTLAPDVEGFGLVYLEAGTAGLPVVATRSGGIPDAVVDGETGLFVPEGDPVALAEALARLFDDAALRTRLGDGGQARALRFTWDRTADALLSILFPS